MAHAHRPSFPSRIRRTLPAGVAGMLLAACGDPSCVFSAGGCQDSGTTPSLGLAAELPTAGGLIVDGPPRVVQSGPVGAGVAASAPIAVFFNESISDQNLGDSIELRRVTQFGAPPVPVTPQRIAAGRGLVLLPLTDLPVGEQVQVVYVGGDNRLFDLTGQELDLGDGTILADFTVAFDAPAVPEIIAVWPPQNAEDQSRTPQIAVVFDRPMDALTLADPSAWTVLEGGVAPANDPDPQPITAGAFGFGVQDTRVWTWESVDADGELVSLAGDTQIELVLSPSGAEILGEDTTELPENAFEFRTAGVAPPTDVALISSPSDAIGSANLVLDGGSELALEVTLDGAQTGDFVEILLFGTELGDDPEFVAIAREFELTGPGPFDTVIAGLAELDLVDEEGSARFADGDLFFGFALRRGTDVSPIRLLDLEADLAGTQTALLDTTPPGLFELAGVETGDGTIAFRSDARDLALFGRATEPLRAVRVTTALGDNVTGDDPPAVLGSDDSGDFLAAPVPLGQLATSDQDLAFQVVLFDRALNASTEPFEGTFRQVGGIGPEPLVVGGAGSPIEVEVFDAVTLAPIEDADVWSFQDQGALSSTPVITAAQTDAAGLATVTSHSLGQVGTIVAVQAGGYSTFIYHDPTAARLSLGLEPVTGADSITSASLAVISPLAQLTIPASNIDVVFSDSRRPSGTAPLLVGGACAPTSGVLACPLGPYAAGLGRPGNLAGFAADFTLSLASFSPALFLRGGDVLFGAGAIDSAGFTPPVLTIETLFTEPGVPSEDLPLAGPEVALSAGLTQGIDLMDLVVSEPWVSEPRVFVDVPVPGLTGAAVIGTGAGYELADTEWTLRSAYPGAIVTALADLGTPADLFHVGAELQDSAGNLSGVRFPDTESQTFGDTLFPASTPEVQFPTEAGDAGSASFAITLRNSLLDDTFQFLDPGYELGSGFYAARLVDSTGAVFDVVRHDQDDDLTATAELRLPELGPAGGAAPASGTVTITARSAAWNGFRDDAFLLSDEARERNFYAHTAVRTASIP